MPKKRYSPIALCPVHGIFEATGFASFGEFNRNISYVGCTTSCPKCGRRSEVIPGTYNPAADGMNILLDPSISAEALAAIKIIAQRAVAGTITPAAARAEIEKIEPRAASVFDFKSYSIGDKLAAFALLISLVDAAANLRAADPPTTIIHNQTVVQQGWDPPPPPDLAKKTKKPGSGTKKSGPVPRPKPKH